MKRRPIESWAKLYILEDIWSEILSRLPVKSLLQFRCVSKSWRSLIDNPNFYRLHLNNFKDNRHENHLLVVERSFQSWESFCLVRCGNTFEPITRRHSLNSVRFPGSWCIICSMDGLVLLQDFGKTNKLMLWNPSIRRIRVLPPSPVNVTTKEPTVVDLGFGFNPLIKDYKHVRLVRRGSKNLHSVEVYTIGTGVWKTAEFEGRGLSGWHWNFKDICAKQTVCFGGALYCTLWNSKSNARELVSFDLSNEVFASISLPGECNLKSEGYTRLIPMLVDGGDSLGLVEHLVTPTQANIWVMERSRAGTGASICWTKRNTFAPSVCDLCPYDSCALDILYIRKTGDMILQGCGRVVSYNLKYEDEKPLLESGHGLHLDMICGYINSLVLLSDPTC